MEGAFSKLKADAETGRTRNITNRVIANLIGAFISLSIYYLVDVMYSLWTEKYRPIDFESLVGQEIITDRIRELVTSKQMLHMLFAGPPGVGKSTMALIIAKRLFGGSWRGSFLELNSSDERGIDVIRSKVKEFARVRSVGDFNQKIVFLDEADALTSEAQNALRRIMETYSESCKFILSCNYPSRIIDPIKSRCALFRFRSLTKDDVKRRLADIAKIEGISVNEGALETVGVLADGDLRKGINILQAAATNAKTLDEKIIYEIASTANPAEIKEMLKLSIDGNFLEARKILQKLFFVDGVSGEEILKNLLTEVHRMEYDHKDKLKLIEKIGEYEFRMEMGSNELIQIESLLAQFAALK